MMSSLFRRRVHGGRTICGFHERWRFGGEGWTGDGKGRGGRTAAIHVGDVGLFSVRGGVGLVVRVVGGGSGIVVVVVVGVSGDGVDVSVVRGSFGAGSVFVSGRVVLRGVGGFFALGVGLVRDVAEEWKDDDDEIVVRRRIAPSKRRRNESYDASQGISIPRLLPRTPKTYERRRRGNEESSPLLP